MKKIHNLTIEWLTEQGRLIEGELYISRYYPQPESKAASPVWKFEVTEDLVVPQPDKYINLLCQNDENGCDFHHLKLPSGFLSACRHLLSFDDRSKRFIIQLSADKTGLFYDQNGIGNVNFGIFYVDQ